jgi:hypothetical protein
VWRSIVIAIAALLFVAVHSLSAAQSLTPNVPAADDVVDRMLALAEVAQDDVAYDTLYLWKLR